jgi:hypothetical protein
MHRVHGTAVSRFRLGRNSSLEINRGFYEPFMKPLCGNHLISTPINIVEYVCRPE